MQYQLINDSDCIKLLEDGGMIRFVPNDSRNLDWQAYQAWLAADPENNIPLPAE